MDCMVAVPQEYNIVICVNLPGFYYILCENYESYDRLAEQLHNAEPSIKFDVVRNYLTRQYVVLIAKEN